MILKKQIKKVWLLAFFGLAYQEPLMLAENDKDVLTTFFHFDTKTGLHQAPSFYDKDALRDESKLLNKVKTDEAVLNKAETSVSAWLFDKLTNKESLNPLTNGETAPVKEIKLLINTLFLKCLWDYLVTGGTKEEKDLVWCLSQSDNPKQKDRKLLSWQLPAENAESIESGLKNFSRTKAFLKELRAAAANKVAEKNANDAKANKSTDYQSLSESDEFVLFKKDLGSNPIIVRLDKGKQKAHEYYRSKQSDYGEKSFKIINYVASSIEKLEASENSISEKDITSAPENILNKITDVETAIASFESSRFESSNKSHQIVIKELRKIRAFNSLRKLCESLIAQQNTDFHKEFSVKKLEAFISDDSSGKDILSLLRKEKLRPETLLSEDENMIQTSIKKSFNLDCDGKNYITPAEAFNFLVIATSALTCGMSYGLYKLVSFIKARASKKQDVQGQDQNDAASAENDQIDPAPEATLKEYEETLQDKVEQEG